MMSSLIDDDWLLRPKMRVNSLSDRLQVLRIRIDLEVTGSRRLNDQLTNSFKQ